MMIFKKKTPPKKSNPKKKTLGFPWGKLIFAFLFLICATSALAFSLLELVPQEQNQKKYSKAQIQKLLNSESLVYYSDEKTILGSFFKNEHRRYVPIEQIPIDIQHAIVASEDSRFFDHKGVDWKGMARAAWTNVSSGKLRQGGSTLSQQTAKNLYGRSGRNLQGKWEELQNTLQLEKNFSKEQILEFYLNQFHVVGSGRGVGIAAEYFFNKNLKLLNLRECAFIAGSVKGPFAYDPYIQTTSESRQKAVNKAEIRANYVLKRMLENNFIDQKRYDQAIKDKLHFVKGEFRFDDVSQLSLIDQELKSPQFQKILQDAGVENWQNEQLKIVTTLDHYLQEESLISLRKQLTTVGMLLEGWQPSKDKVKALSSVERGDLLTAEITEVKGTTNTPKVIYLRAGDLRLKIDSVQISEFKKNLEKSPQTRGRSSAVISSLKPSTHLLVSALLTADLRTVIPARIETKTTIQGAGIIYKEGKILSTVSGFNNVGFDRVFNAERQFGSTWKPILYALALKHGWHAQDLLENNFNTFWTGHQIYKPQADHKDKGNAVTMQWACTRSENIASVWLLSHLFAKKSASDLLALGQQKGFYPKNEEELNNFSQKLKSLKLPSLEFIKQEIQFEQAKTAALAPLDSLSRLHYSNLQFLPKSVAKESNLHWTAISELYLSALHAPESVQWVIDSTGQKSIFSSQQVLTSQWKPTEPEAVLDNFLIQGFVPGPIVANILESITNSPIQNVTLENITSSLVLQQNIALQVFSDFTKELGIKKNIKQILSLVLGSNDITLFEMTRAYHTLTTGVNWQNPKNTENKPSLIQKILTRDGSLIYENSLEKKIILEPTLVDELNAMLESVVINGTARSARSLVRMNAKGFGLEYPIAGKTGTTNEYKNSVFIGVVAGIQPSNKNFDYKIGASVGSYIGYDLNKPMVNGDIKITGSQGALPYWANMAISLMRSDPLLHTVNFNNSEWISKNRILVEWTSPYLMQIPHPYSGLPINSDSTQITKNWIWTLKPQNFLGL
jgi:penicillin-binding protein 1A